MGREGEEQRDAERHDAQGEREDDRGPDSGPVGRAAPEAREIVEADPLRRSAERVGQLKGLNERPERRDEEEEQQHEELRREQQIGERPRSRKASASAPLFGSAPLAGSAEPGLSDGRRLGRRPAPAPQYGRHSPSRTDAEPRCRARRRRPSPSAIGFCPSSPAWISSLIAMFAWALLPRRKPRELSLGVPRVELDDRDLARRAGPCNSPATSPPRRRPGSPARSRSPCATRPACRLGEEVVEGRDALVVLVLVALERPEGGAADRAVLRRAVRPRSAGRSRSN